MIYICMIAASCLCIVLGVLVLKMMKDLETVQRQVISMSTKVADNKDAIEFVNGKVNEIKNQMEDLNGDSKLNELLEKKWEDAIQVISNYDPFGEDDK